MSTDRTALVPAAAPVSETETIPAVTSAIIITKPEDADEGAKTVLIGPLTPATAAAWAGPLRAMSYQAQQGTTIEIAPWPAEVASGSRLIHPDSIPRVYEDMLAQFRDEPGYPENGGFPDLLQRLEMVHGHTRACQWWDWACTQVDSDAAYAEAADQGARDRAEAAELLGRAAAAMTAANRKISSLVAAAGKWEFDAAPGGDASDALHYANSAARELRAAVRALADHRED